MKLYKKLLILMVMLLAFFMGMAYASSSTETITVNYLPLKYYFDGLQKRPAENQRGFIYNNTTYVPLRFIGEALGKEVEWDQKTYSIYINEYPKERITYITDLKAFTTNSYNYELKDYFVTNRGDQYYNVHTVTGELGHFVKEYVLDGKYTRFKALIAPSEGYAKEAKDGDIGRFEIHGDYGKLFDSGPIPSDLLEPIIVDVDILGVQNLMIKFYSNRSPSLGLINAHVVK